MSDSEDGNEFVDSETSITVNDAYHLRKQDLIVELRKRGVECSDADKRDELREKLVELVRAELVIATQADVINEEEAISDEDSMAGNSKIEFKTSTDDWESFTERLELHCKLKKGKEDEKVPLLLTSIDEEAYLLLKGLTAPDKPATKTYDELVKLMSDHLNPKPSSVMERWIFRKASQGKHESIAVFVARLRKMALHCEFGDKLGEALRDQLVCGVIDENLRTELFKSTDLTFADAEKKALAYESAVKNATGSEVTRANQNQDVFSMDSNATRAKQGQKNARTRPEVTCYCCGRSGHFAAKCHHRGATCHACGKKGHLQNVCLSQKGRKKTANKFLKEDTEEDDSQDVNDSESTSGNNFIDFFPIRASVSSVNFAKEHNLIRAEPQLINVEINGKILEMEIDTGTYFTVVSEKTYKDFFENVKLDKACTKLRNYEQQIMKPLGQLNNLNAKFNNIRKNLFCLVLQGNSPPLIGRQWLAEFQQWPMEFSDNTVSRDVNTLFKFDVMNAETQILTEFKVLFGNTPGLYNRKEIALRLKENTKPIALRPRHVPFALKEKVEREIDMLIKLGHMEKVDSSEWATPLVPILKSNGAVRICGDFKLTINPSLEFAKCPFPKIEDIFLVLQNGKTYTQLDLPHAYMQIPVEQGSRDLLTITTHLGLLRYTKMTEGTAQAPGEFQKIMDECLQGIPNTIAYIDNIFVTGPTNEEHMQNLRSVCKSLEERGLRLNRAKCDFFKDRLEVLGFVIDRNGLHKAKSKILAMYEAPRPSNSKQLASFLGLINFYARFLKHRAEKLKPLFECASKEKFEWTQECERAFCWVKNEMISPKVLAHYDPNEQIVLACDASEYGLSAILSHKYKDGSERPIAYASKIIPTKERNRAIIDKEAGAIVFGFMKFYDFVYGQNIILRTDHKPLEIIFGPKRGIPLTAASRLQRWAYFLSGFNYKIETIKSEQNSNCDALSRLPIEDDTAVFTSDFTPVYYTKVGMPSLDWRTVQAETKSDATLCKIMKFCVLGWPHDSTTLSSTESKFFSKRNEIAIEDNCLFWGYRIIIPKTLRPYILDELHASHLGIVKMKAWARSYVWWPNIDLDLENVAKSCEICLENTKKPPYAPLTPWPWPDKAWERVHLDFLGPFYGDMFLVVVDAHSKWPEVINFKNNTKAKKVVEVCEALFARHGLPCHLVTDNGRQFASAEFKDFLQKHGIKQSFSPPYHPASNGAAENFVGTFKDKIKKIVQGGKEVGCAVNSFLFDYRSTPHCTTGKSPAALLYKRELRTRFDLLRPRLKGVIGGKQEAQAAARPHPRNVTLEAGDQVFMDNHAVSGGKRVRAEITKKLSPSTFEVATETGITTKRHTDQLIKPLRRSARIANRDKKRSKIIQIKKGRCCDVCVRERTAQLNTDLCVFTNAYLYHVKGQLRA